jgi:hypothetical protein
VHAMRWDFVAPQGWRAVTNQVTPGHFPLLLSWAPSLRDCIPLKTGGRLRQFDQVTSLHPDTDSKSRHTQPCLCHLTPNSACSSFPGFREEPR